MVKAGTFREDLYFRIRSMEIAIPPLRDRGQDAIHIAKCLVVRICEKMNPPPQVPVAGLR